MSLFTSNRERRLWLWALAVVVAIYSTLGLARTLAGHLRTHGLLEALFMVSFLLVGAVILIYGLKARPGGLEIGVALGVAAVYILVFVPNRAYDERDLLFNVLAAVMAVAASMALSYARRWRFRNQPD
ncbi:MAG: hypothetical protein OXO50_11620 [Caldilineaceae bacterium]|nr:hypothetical protein [Caldilineaceae bacterium]